MWLPSFVYRFIGRQIADNLGLEDKMDSPWYKNKSTLSHIFNALVGVATSAVGIVTSDFHGTLPGWLVKGAGLVMTLASAIGIYDNHS